MKTKLLKKLRKKITIRYYIARKMYCVEADFFDQEYFYNLKDAKEDKNKRILRKARLYYSKYGKNILIK